MRAPAVLIFGADEFVGAAKLRPLGKSAAVIHRFAVADRYQNIAAANLVAEEMRRGRHDGGVGRMRPQPVDAGKMKAADAAGLMAPGAADVVEPTLETCSRADVLQLEVALGGFLQGADNIVIGEE